MLMTMIMIILLMMLMMMMNADANDGKDDADMVLTEGQRACLSLD